jgi:hypothetical protein
VCERGEAEIDVSYAAFAFGLLACASGIIIEWSGSLGIDTTTKPSMMTMAKWTMDSDIRAAISNVSVAPLPVLLVPASRLWGSDHIAKSLTDRFASFVQIMTEFQKAGIDLSKEVRCQPFTCARSK